MTNDVILILISCIASGFAGMIAMYLSKIVNRADKMQDSFEAMQGKVGELIAEVARVIERDSYSDSRIKDHEDRLRCLEKKL